MATDERDRIFTAQIIAAIKEAGKNILLNHGGWGKIEIEFRRGEVSGVYESRLARYIQGDKDDAC